MQYKKVYKNILIFNPAFLGDTILTTPLIRLVKYFYPQSYVTFCVRPEHASLYINHHLIDNVIVYDKRNKFKGLKGILLFAKYLKHFNFDLVLNLHKSFRSTLLFLLVNPPFIVGFKQAILSSFFSRRVNRENSIHEVERNLMILEPIVNNFKLSQGKLKAGSPFCFFDENIYSNITKYKSSTTGSKHIIGFAVGSTWKTKCWNTEKFVQVASILYENNFAIALYGSNTDKEQIEKFKTLYKYPFYDFTYKTQMNQLSAFIKLSTILLVNDSGLMHIAVAMSIPVIAIFGSTVPAQGFTPYDNISKIVEINNLSCRPCGKHGFQSCPKKHFKCMNLINADTVLNNVYELIKECKL